MQVQQLAANCLHCAAGLRHTARRRPARADRLPRVRGPCIRGNPLLVQTQIWWCPCLFTVAHIVPK